MVHYNRFDIKEGIYFIKDNRKIEYLICHCCFLNLGLKFEDSACNGCHDLTLLSVNISNIAIITFKNVDYPCIVVEYRCVTFLV